MPGLLLVSICIASAAVIARVVLFGPVAARMAAMAEPARLPPAMDTILAAVTSEPSRMLFGPVMPERLAINAVLYASPWRMLRDAMCRLASR